MVELENKSNAQIALGLAAEGKIDQAVELAITAIDSGSKPTLWMHRKEVCRILEKCFKKEGITPFLLTGDQTAKKREENALQAVRLTALSALQHMKQSEPGSII